MGNNRNFPCYLQVLVIEIFLSLCRKLFEKDAFSRKSERVLRFKAKKLLDTQLQALLTQISLDHVADSTKVILSFVHT